jgi:hypothetical protein
LLHCGVIRQLIIRSANIFIIPLAGYEYNGASQSR